MTEVKPVIRFRIRDSYFRPADTFLSGQLFRCQQGSGDRWLVNAGEEIAYLLPLEGGGYEQKTFDVTRRPYESVSVRAKLLEKDATVGIVSISGFDLTTPHQFREAVDGLLSQGVQHFVFDVRNNPGGDLQSIKAVLSYFCRRGIWCSAPSTVTATWPPATWWRKPS